MRLHGCAVFAFQRVDRVECEIVGELFVCAHCLKADHFQLQSPPHLPPVDFAQGMLSRAKKRARNGGTRQGLWNAFRKVISPVRILVLIVPSGSPVLPAISEWLRPSKYAISRALR